MPHSPDFQFDVFLSHNQADKPRVRRLAERLRAAGLRVWFDEWIIQPGDDIYLAIERGLEASRTLVLCLSPAALGSDWVGLERSTVLFRDPANAGRRFIPLLLADCNLPDTLRRYKYVDCREEAEEAFSELLASFQLKSAEVLQLPLPPEKDILKRESQSAKPPEMTKPLEMAERKLTEREDGVRSLELSSDGKTLRKGSNNETSIEELQQACADYIYGPPQGQYPVAALGKRRRVLIVEDHEPLLCFVEAVVRELYPSVEVMTANDGVTALEIFRPGSFAVVITDIVMPGGIFGFELAKRLLADDPDLVIVAMSGYTCDAEGIASFYEAGGFRFLPKPFNVKILQEILDIALGERLPRLFRRLSLIAKDRGVFLQQVARISDSVHSILGYAKREGHIAHSLLRHKLKHTVADFLKSLGSETDILKKAEAVLLQSESLCRLAWVTAKASESAFPSFLRQYVSDLQLEHHGLKVHLRMESSVDELIRGCSGETILALVTCELLDNAINALSGTGRISVDVALLRSTEQLSIVVRDDGPGVSAANLTRLFQQGFSTKGEGRGLGLHLVQEAVRQLGGKVTYKRLKGACFSVVIPLERPPTRSAAA